MNPPAARARPCPGRSAGFTLIEILITLVILSTGIVLILEAFQTSLVALGESRDVLRADLLARNRLNELSLDVLESGPPQTGRTEGTFEAPYEAYRWAVETEEAEGGAGTFSNRLLRVTVTVWREGREPQVSVATLVGAPTPAHL